jgi:formamidopyrimidine-DNA glycosylase
VPELPDVTVYIEALERALNGRPLQGIRLVSPFVLRTASPTPQSLVGQPIRGVERIGKRIVLRFPEDHFFVVHLMIAGRFKWSDETGAPIPGKIGLAAMDFASGTLLLTEASSKKRASIHVVVGREALRDFDRGGLDVLEATEARFVERLRAQNHTLKRSLTDPRIFDGIGNAYSDEILFEAGLSPMKLSQKLDDAEAGRLFRATQTVLSRFTDAIRSEAAAGFPPKVTAFRPDMKVHGRYRQPCTVCGTKIMRIAFAENELNYCPRCQNEGRLLADRSLSRLMKKDWPKTIEELER